MMALFHLLQRRVLFYLPPTHPQTDAEKQPQRWKVRMFCESGRRTARHTSPPAQPSPPPHVRVAHLFCFAHKVTVDDRQSHSQSQPQSHSSVRSLYYMLTGSHILALSLSFLLFARTQCPPTHAPTPANQRLFDAILAPFTNSDFCLLPPACCPPSAVRCRPSIFLRSEPSKLNARVPA